MSYCRFGDESDVYMYPANTNEIWCCACQLEPERLLTQEEALEHLEEHRGVGHQVPQHAIERLKREIAERGKQ